MRLLNRLNVGIRLSAGFALLLALMVITIGVGFNQMRLQQSSLEELSGEFRERIHLINLMRDSARFQAIALRDVVAQEDIAFKKNELKQMREARQQYKNASEILTKNMGDSNAQQQMETIRKLEESVAEGVTQVMEDTLNDEHALARDGIRDVVRPRQITLIKALENLQQEIENRGLVRVQQATASSQAAENILLYLGVTAFVLGAIAAWSITRSIVGPLVDSVEFAHRIAAGDLTARIRINGSDELARLQSSLDIMADQLGVLIREVTQAAEASNDSTAALTKVTDEGVKLADETSGHILEVSAVMTRMIDSIRLVSNGARTVAEAAGTTQRVALNGEETVALGEKAIARVVSGMSEYAVAIRGLEKRIQSISTITAAIREIADQTNLLALNAAIEAARAGESGRGFAVVADEVRQLAEKTTCSTESISDTIKGVHSQMDSVISAIQVVNESVQHSATLSSKTIGLFADILKATQEVVNEAEQINAAALAQDIARQSTEVSVKHIIQLADREATTMSGIGHVSLALRDSSKQLHDLIVRFRV